MAKKKEIKVLIAVICNYEMVPVYFMKSAMNLYMATKEQFKTDMITFNAIECNLMRNYACKHAIENGYDYIFQLDTDMTFPENSIIELIKHNKEFVTGSAVQKTEPYFPTQYRSLDGDIKIKENRVIPLGNELIEIAGSGSVGALIKIEIFKKLKYPYYNIEYESNGEITGGDINFCRQLNKQKIKMYLDPKIKYAHATTFLMGYNQK